VQTLNAPTLADVHAALASFQPNVLYLWAGCSGTPVPATSTLQPLVLPRPDGTAGVLPPSDLLTMATITPLHALLLNVQPEGLPLTELRPLVPHVMHWTAGARLPVTDTHQGQLCVESSARSDTRWKVNPSASTWIQSACPCWLHVSVLMSMCTSLHGR
jgi:hypothetical protein